MKMRNEESNQGKMIEKEPKPTARAGCLDLSQKNTEDYLSEEKQKQNSKSPI
jgi:hypothetical protein